MNPWKCIICGKPVADYEPVYCCNSTQCGCRGLPIEPCLCDKCADRIENSYTINKDETPFD